MSHGAMVLGAIYALAVAPPAAAQDSPAIFDALEATEGGLRTAEVVERVLQVNTGVAKAEAGAARRARTARRAWLGYVPRVDLAGTYTKLSEVDIPDFDPDGPGPTPPQPNPFPVFLDLYSFDASVAVPVSDYFLQIVHGYKAAKNSGEIGALQLRAEREATALLATEVHVGVIRARAAQLVTTSSVRALESNLADVTALAAAGIVPEADRLQVAAQLGNARVSQRQATGLLSATENRLRIALNRPAEFDVSHGENFFELPDIAPPAKAEILERALSQRPELLAMRRIVEMNDRWRKYYRGGKFPKIAVNAQGQYANPNQRIFPPVDEYRETWAVGASIRWSPNDYIQADSLMHDWELNVQQAEQDVRAIEDGIRNEVEEAYTFYEVSRSSIDAATDALTAAQTDYKDRQQLLAAGESTTRDLLASEAALRNAELQLVNAYLDVRVALARLDKAMGRLAPAPTQEKQ